MVFFLFGIFVGVFVISSVFIVFLVICVDLYLSDIEGFWFVDVYVLLFVVMLIVVVWIGDVFGWKMIVLIGLVGFVVFNVVGGLVMSGLLLIVVCVLFGVVEVFVVVGVVVIIGVKFYVRECVFVYGLWMVMFGIGSVFGFVFGGILVEGFGWCWLFLGSVLFVVLVGVFVVWFVLDLCSL